MTLVCGKNNTGKTYATYALYGFLSEWRRWLTADIRDSSIDDLKEHGVIRIDINDYAERIPDILERASKRYRRNLPQVFGSRPERFRGTEFRLSVSPTPAFLGEHHETVYFGRSRHPNLTLYKAPEESILTVSWVGNHDTWPVHLLQREISDAVIGLVFESCFPRVFLASAERTGATLFLGELDFARGRLLETVGQSEDSLRQLELLGGYHVNYPLPVRDNLEFVRGLDQLITSDSFLTTHHRDVLHEFSDIIGGDYRVDENNRVSFRPKHRRLYLSMDESSSAVRSLVLLAFYLRHVAKRGDLLMIDEPELNLHPQNQRRMARLFARLVNLGVDVFVTTHSDYIVKELNTLIMLNQDKPHLRRISSKERYRPEEFLKPEQVSVYLAEPVETEAKGEPGLGHTLSRARINEEYGIEARSFDDTINEMNEIQDAILWGDDE